jgi:pimeloyl-ACP methyl ester carboxylesterase
VDAVDAVAAGLGKPVILVGHSMGGFIAQKYLESKPADLGVLLASIPPTGGSSFGRRLMRRHPRSFLKTLFTLRAADSVRMTREMLFTADTPEHIIQDCHNRLAKESLRILIDMNTPILTEEIKTPVVAIGADEDEMVATREEVAATAKAYGTEPIHVPGGHDLMLDTHWEEAATAIAAAIEERLPFARGCELVATRSGKPEVREHARVDEVGDGLDPVAIEHQHEQSGGCAIGACASVR